MKKNRIIAVAAAGLLLLVASVTSCQIGLGEAVDTEAPTVSISYPPDSAIIRESFVLAGTCNDDQGINTVKVTITNTDTYAKYSYNAVVTGKTWSVQLNGEGGYNGYAFPDGRYTADVYALDNAERTSGIASRSFDIDNTAPVLILSKPNSFGGSLSTATFGRVLKLAGDISEDHTTESLVLHYQEYNGSTPVGNREKIVVNNVTEMSADSPLVVARYYLPNEIVSNSTKENLRNEYMKMYPYITDETQNPLTGKYDFKSSGDKEYFCAIELTDNARVYQNPGDNGSGHGNISSVYYVNDVDNKFMTSLMTDTSYGLTADKLKKLINGTGKDYNDSQKAAIIGILNSNQGLSQSSKEISTSSSSFKMDPKNNPTFEISTFSLGTNDGFKALSTGSNLNLTITAGKDNMLVKPSSVTVKLYEMKDNPAGGAGSYIRNEAVKPFYLIDSTNKNAKAWTESDDTIVRKAIPIENSLVNEDKKSLRQGGKYEIEITALDREGNEAVSENSEGYGFTLNSSSNPPTITILTHQDEIYSGDKIKNEGLEVLISVVTDGVDLLNETTGDTYAKNIRVYKSMTQGTADNTVSVVNSSDNSVPGGVTVGVTKPTVLEEGSSGHTYILKLKIGGTAASVPSTPGKYKYSFYIQAADSVPLLSSALFTFYVDNEPPKVNKIEVSHPVTVGTEKVLNGNVDIKATASDNDELKDIRYWVYAYDEHKTEEIPVIVGVDKDEDGKPDGISCGTSDPDFTVNTNLPAFDSYKEGDVTYYKNLRVKFVAEDKVGNKCDPVYAYYKKEGSATDYEYKVDQNSDMPLINGGNFTEISKEADLNSASGNIFDKDSKLIGSLSDDDGISEASITFYTDSTKSTKVVMPSGTANPRDLSSYNGKTFNDVVLPSAGGTYYVVIDVKDSKYNEAAADATINGTVDSDRKKAIEGYRKNTFETWIAIDNSVPEITETAVGTEEIQFVKDVQDDPTTPENEAEIKFAGTVSDAGDWKLSSSPLKVTVNNGTPISITPDASGKWTYSKDMSSVEERTYEFVFEVTDQSGKTNTVTRTYSKDKTKPVFGTGTADTQDAAYDSANIKPSIITAGTTTGTETWYKVTTLQIKGTVGDGLSGSGVSKVEYTTDNGTTWKNFETSTDKATKVVTYTGTISNLTNGATIKIKAVDKAGNENTGDISSINIDLGNPSGESGKFAYVTPPESGVQPTAPLEADYSAISGTVIANGTKDLWVKGTADDALSGIKSILLKCGSNDFSTPDASITVFTPAGEADKPNKIAWEGRIPADVISSALAATSTGSLWGRISDKAGNIYDVPLFTIMYDGQYPEAKITDIKYKGTQNTVNKANKKITIKGVAKDNQALTSVKLEYYEKTAYDALSPAAQKTAQWKQYGEAYTSDPYNPTFDVDTEAKDGASDLFIDGKTYYFRFSATDSATNTGNSFKHLNEDAYLTTEDGSGSFRKEIQIQQDSDRPKITLTTLNCGASMSPDVTKHAHLYNINKLYFSANDDDGINKLEIRFGYSWINTRTENGENVTYTYYTKTPVPQASDKIYKDAGCITEFTEKKVESYTPASGDTPASIRITGDEHVYSDLPESWKDMTDKDSITIEKDGPYIIVFRITDASEEKTVFTSGASGTKGPVLSDSAGNEYNDDTQLYVDVDMNGPKTRNQKYASHDGTAYVALTDDVKTLKFGGDYNKFKISIDLFDENGVKSVTLKHPESSKNQVITDDPVSPEKRDGNWHTWEISDIDVSTLPTGVNSFGLIIEDYAGNKDESTFNITVDNSAPELTVENYDENTLLGTPFVLKGTVRGYDNTTQVKFFTSNGSSAIDENHANWSDSTKYTLLKGEVGSWRINVDGNVNKDDGETHTKNHKQLFVDAWSSLNIKYDADQSLVLNADNSRYRTPQRLYFHFLTTDAVGNKSVKTFYLRIDPQGDIPTVTMTYPVKDDSQVLTGKIRAQGTASVKGSNSIVGVYIQIDPTFDTSFDAASWSKSTKAETINAVLCPNGDKLNDKLPASNKIEYIYERYNAIPGVTQKPENSNHLYGIFVGNSASWNYTLNENDELNGVNSNSTIGIRMYVVDSSGGINELDTNADVSFQIDSKAPKIGSSNQLYMYQYAWTKADGSKTYYTNQGTVKTNTGSIKNGDSVDVYTKPGCNTADKETATGTYSETTDSITVSGVEYKRNWSSLIYDELNTNWLAGEWWLTGSVEDDSGISLIKDTVHDYQIYPVISANTASNVTQASWNNEATKGFIFNYRVGSTADNQAGELNYILYVEDGSEAKNPGNKEIKVSYDNKRPEFNTDDGNLKINHKVMNSEGFYSLSSSAYETDTANGKQSGFARTVFYFTRTSNKKIFDPYLKKGTDNGNNQNYESLRKSADLYWKTNTVTGINGKDVTLASADSNIHKGGFVEFGGVYYTIKARVSSTVYTLDKAPAATLVNSPIYFAIGQVVDVVGSESTGTTTYGASDGDEGYGYYKDSADNDDDFMIESVITTNGMTKWTGSINSNNISDGAIVIHYVVFDVAGNHNYGTVSGADVKVENNTPRLASVKVWCDFNEDSTEQADESKSFYYNGSSRRVDNKDVTRATETTDKLVVSGNKLGIPTKADEKNTADTTKSGNAFMTVKNKVTFYPEIIGGNNQMYYQFMYGDSTKFIGAYDLTAKDFKYSSFIPKDASLKGQSATTAQAAAGTNYFGMGHDDGIDQIADNSGYYKLDYYNQKYVAGHTGYGTNDATPYAIEVSTDMLEKLGNNTNSWDPTWFEVIIWDKTEGATVFENSLKATMQIALNVQYTDNTPPVVNVNRFFFDQFGVDENNVPMNSLYKGLKSNGHIELEGQLTGISAGTTALKNELPEAERGNRTDLNETDPKVSGKITIRGTAYDDIRLKELYLKFPGFTKTGQTIGTALTKVASYNKDASHLGWTSESPDTEANMTSNGWTFTVTDVYNNEDGHLANWEFSVDTELITNKAAKGVGFQFQAKDLRGVNSDGTKGKVSSDQDSLSNTAVSKYNRPGYTMDVVPYITKVITPLSAADEDNPSVYSRTSLGRYPLYMTRSGFKSGTSWTNGYAQIYGFNFDKDSGKSYVQYDVADTAASKKIASSGDFTIYQNKIPSLNNVNVNDAKGADVELTQDNYSVYAYNRQPNGENNNLLTDDVKFDVWQINSAAAKPKAGRADNPVMKINPNSGMIGFAFSNGSEKFSMPGTISDTEYSYYWWNMSYDFLKWNALAYDRTGHTYACTVGGDINGTKSTADNFTLMTDRWTRANPGSATNVGGSYLRIDTIGQKGITGEAEASDNYSRDKNRFQSQSIATYRQTGATDVYMAYYDKLNNEIRFKAGQLADTDSVGAKVNFGTFLDIGANTAKGWKDTSDQCQVIANGNSTNTLGKAGQYLAIDVTQSAKTIGGTAVSANTVVLVWYDGTDLQYAYNTTPLNGIKVSTTQADNTGFAEGATTKGISKSGWTKAANPLLTNAGKYCQMVIDSDNGVHIAAYDEQNSSLKYVYIKNITQPENAITATVDSYLDVGENLTIDVAKDGDYQIPSIGYWGGFNEKPRYAYLAEPEGFYTETDKDGTDEMDRYTGVWECSVIPTVSEPTQNTINVGLWKYNGTATDNGKLAYSTTGTNRGKTNGTNNYTNSDSYTSLDYGKCYGNGSKNAVLGYVINIDGSTRYIETAQKK